MGLSLEHTQELLEIVESENIQEDLEEFIARLGYDESNEPDLEYDTKTITYEYRFVAKMK